MLPGLLKSKILYVMRQSSSEKKISSEALARDYFPQVLKNLLRGSDLQFCSRMGEKIATKLLDYFGNSKIAVFGVFRVSGYVVSDIAISDFILV